ncbi:LAME_0F10044g1_1 [Lachancea meyersii CBS 8951]|uniref:LAME_0F10044g1_1 n=1 Tax=Lachancea meyersii CBS 8951 TaxID=1266667 RepID=A0A1G4JV92_9SACH|nr:LAME_0F10044g1_1 [Lachancea meyersii CBS 8951]
MTSPSKNPRSEDPQDVRMADADDEELDHDGDYSTADQTPLSMTPGPSAGNATPTASKVKKPDHTPTKNQPQQLTKVPMHLLEKRRLGRLKAAEQYAQKMKTVGIERRDNTTIHQNGLFRALSLINQKNYSSDYLKRDDQIFAMRERKSLRNATSSQNNPEIPIDDEDQDSADEEGETNTIVIHPGSQFLKIGFATDVLPQSIPSCIAVPKTPGIAKTPAITRQFDQEAYNETKEHIQNDFKERMRYYKRKIMPNSHEAVVNFNTRVQPEKIPEHNDLHRVEWIQQPTKVYYGEEATRCLPAHFNVRNPFFKGKFNVESPNYRSLQELLSDVCELLKFALSHPKLNIKQAQIPNYKVVLVVADVHEKAYVETFIQLLLIDLKFQAVAIIQESLASCYGAGISDSTCVVDIGATSTKIACVDEGLVVDNSIISLDFGGNDVTRLFAKFLLESKFPYPDIDLTSPQGWTLMESLKEKYATFQDADVTIQLYNFIKRIPGKPGAEKFEFKVFDEVMTSPMGLFFPEMFALIKTHEQPVNEYVSKQLPRSRDLFSYKDNNLKSISQLSCQKETTYCDLARDLDVLQKLLNLPSEIEDYQQASMSDLTPTYTALEKAIVESITNACVCLDNNYTKATNFYSNILVVGGSSKFPSLDFILTDRINIWRPRLLSVNTLPTFYDKIAKQVKEFEQTNKLVEIKDKEELAAQKKKLAKTIKMELQSYWEGVDALGGSESVFPINVLPAPREMDPSLLTWKGGSVFARLKLIEELYVTSSDWDILGSRILQYKCIFDY